MRRSRTARWASLAATALVGCAGASGARGGVPVAGGGDRSAGPAPRVGLQAVQAPVAASRPPAGPAPIPHVEIPLHPAEERLRPAAPAAIHIEPIEPEDWQGTSRIFLHIARTSPTAYDLDLGEALPPDAADGLLGPVLPWPAQRRPFAMTIPMGHGQGVVDRPPSPEGEALLVEAELARRSGHEDVVRARLAELTRRDPGFGAGWVALAGADLGAGDLAAGQAALEEARRRGVLDPYADTLRAEIALREGDRRSARRSLAAALALYPGFPAALDLAPVVTGRKIAWRPLPLRARVVEEAPGKVLVQADTRRTGVYLAWALCEATSRYEVERSLLPFDDGPEGMHLRRELACGLALADAATGPVATLGTEARDLPEPGLEPEVLRVRAIAEAGFLGEMILYEILAPRFPALLLHVTPGQRRRLEAYVDRWVLPP